METKETKTIIANLRRNSRQRIKNIANENSANGRKRFRYVQNNTVTKRVSIPDFQMIGFPFIVAYLVESNYKPSMVINDMHTNNCYRVYGEDTYLIEAIFRSPEEIEEYDEIIELNCKNYFKYYIVEDIKREEFIPK